MVQPAVFGLNTVTNTKDSYIAEAYDTFRSFFYVDSPIYDDCPIFEFIAFEDIFKQNVLGTSISTITLENPQDMSNAYLAIDTSIASKQSIFMISETEA